ncbi:MAG: Txe/YoeB family addiction module toxin [Bacteroidales bacterium]|nr:Txe/YoeB family addiction module toxin [Bacteroidales bacterium]
MYEIQFTKRALADINKIKKSGSKAIKKKIELFLLELQEHPLVGVGNIEQLKGLPNTYSRTIDKKNRLVYEVYDDKILVLVLQALGHYDDK